MKRILLFIFLLGFCSGLSAAQLQLVWSVEGKFSMPESAAYDPKRQAVYLSNVNHYAKDDNGFISRISADGKTVEVEWIKGLHSPTGLTVKGDLLYAVDFDALVVIDLVNEKIIRRIPAVDAEHTPVLNDVALSAEGEVFVSGSRSRTIYKLSDNHLEVWLKDKDKLNKANGLLVYQNMLFHGGDTWTVFDLKSKQPVDTYSNMGRGLVDIDGITSDGSGGFMVSLIDDPRLWSLKKGQQPSPLNEEKVQGIDMHFVEEKQIVFLPRVGNTLSAYRIVAE